MIKTVRRINLPYGIFLDNLSPRYVKFYNLSIKSYYNIIDNKTKVKSFGGKWMSPLEKAVEFIKSSNNIVAFTGAGHQLRVIYLILDQIRVFTARKKKNMDIRLK